MGREVRAFFFLQGFHWLSLVVMSTLHICHVEQQHQASASSLGEVGSLATDGGLLFISMATLEEKRALVGDRNSSLAKESVLVIMLRPLLSSSTNATVSLRVLLGDMALDGPSAWSS